MTTTTIETKVSHKIESAGHITSMEANFDRYHLASAKITVSFPNGGVLDIPVSYDFARIMGKMMGAGAKMTLEFTEPLLVTSTKS